ncbi:hypothetical protein [Actinomadura kijaniata]|uniref:hypothetical protein n=1 Tax=Actinomadura kijaniata TaxID=46161 RepID=UPI000ACFBA34|nr:hypothetical protein [Actinomadura kijaniata]
MGATVREVVGDVVAEAAPEEQPLLRGLYGLDDAGVRRALRRRTARRRPVGFGVTEAVVLVTPMVWMVVEGAVGHAAGEAVGRAGRAGLLRMPEVVLDASADTRGAVTFRRARRHTVCLDAGLVKTLRTGSPGGAPAFWGADPSFRWEWDVVGGRGAGGREDVLGAARFDAVVLHEFAHVRNGDVTLFYAAEEIVIADGPAGALAVTVMGGAAFPGRRPVPRPRPLLEPPGVTPAAPGAGRRGSGACARPVGAMMSRERIDRGRRSCRP